VKTEILSRIAIEAVILVLSAITPAFSQDTAHLDLEKAAGLALQNNHLLNIKRLQAGEKQQKVNEDRVKYFPSVTAAGTYQYNTNLPGLTIGQGSFGQLPLGGIVISLPPTDYRIGMGNHNIYTAGVTFYQPVSQLAKINEGVEVSKAEMKIARAEQAKAAFQIRQAVEKLYFGMLIIRKQVEEAELKVTLAKMKLNDAENALKAGKTILSSTYGLSAMVADEEQNLLKLKMLYDDYAGDMKNLTGIANTTELILDPVPPGNFRSGVSEIDTSFNSVSLKNNDLKIAALVTEKSEHSVRASKYSYLPDIGILGGYTYQHGNILYPENNTFIGASIRWNIQDAFTNRTVQRQRIYAGEQAKESLASSRQQVANDIAKALRKLKQSEELVKVARKVVEFRNEDLKIQSDKYNSGLNLESDLLSAKAAKAKGESDLFAAELNYRITLSELMILTGTY
jgi:outer membrane protein TolC